MTTLRTERPAHADYGYDAPRIMLGLSLGGIVSVVAGCAVAALAPGAWSFAGLTIAALGFLPLVFGLLMVIYALVGKRRTREYMLNLAHWRGDEAVLDVGTGAGLMLIGAAKRSPRGRAVGIDIWAPKDLSGNAAATTTRNAVAEGVADRIDILTGDARNLAFPDESFDLAFSLLCLHNIEDKADQVRACQEIARVLKPGGRAIIGDYVPTHRYAAAFGEAGLTVTQSRAAFPVALSLMWVVVAEKPGLARP